jgi:hypothetical protein
VFILSPSWRISDSEFSLLQTEIVDSLALLVCTGETRFQISTWRPAIETEDFRGFVGPSSQVPG